MHLELQLHCAHKNKIWNLPFTKILHLSNIIPLFAHYMKYLLFLNKPDFYVSILVADICEKIKVVEYLLIPLFSFQRVCQKLWSLNIVDHWGQIHTAFEKM